MPEYTFHEVPTFSTGKVNVEVQRHGRRVGEFRTRLEADEWVAEQVEKRRANYFCASLHKKPTGAVQ